MKNENLIYKILIHINHFLLIILIIVMFIGSIAFISDQLGILQSIRNQIQHVINENKDFKTPKDIDKINKMMQSIKIKLT